MASQGLLPESGNFFLTNLKNTEENISPQSRRGHRDRVWNNLSFGLPGDTVNPKQFHHFVV
jgi:hypothetical protein